MGQSLVELNKQRNKNATKSICGRFSSSNNEDTSRGNKQLHNLLIFKSGQSFVFFETMKT